jgi:hypothetical protein
MDCPFGALEKRISPARFVGQTSLTRQSQMHRSGGCHRQLTPSMVLAAGGEGVPPTPQRLAYGVWHHPLACLLNLRTGSPWRERR